MFVVSLARYAPLIRKSWHQTQLLNPYPDLPQWYLTWPVKKGQLLLSYLLIHTLTQLLNCSSQKGHL